jgi:hypothetical protein
MSLCCKDQWDSVNFKAVQGRLTRIENVRFLEGGGAEATDFNLVASRFTIHDWGLIL